MAQGSTTKTKVRYENDIAKLTDDNFMDVVSSKKQFLVEVTGPDNGCSMCRDFRREFLIAGKSIMIKAAPTKDKYG